MCLALYFGRPGLSGSGKFSAAFKIAPVDGPQKISTISVMARPVCFSIRDMIWAGINPRIPPP